ISIQLRRSNQFVLRAERTNSSWNLTAPVLYPAQSFAAEGVLQLLSQATYQAYVPPEELNAAHRTVAEFGLDVPRATLTFEHPGGHLDVLFGSKTAVGDQVYVRLFTAPGIYVVNAELFDRLPRTATDWRDTALVNVNNLNWD